METRIDRMGLLLDQLNTSCDMSRDRLTGLTEDEYLWEPVPGAWSLRRRATATTPDAYGAGDWVLDADRAIGPFDVGTFSTIAWRLGHLYAGFWGRYEWTFGERRRDPREHVIFDPEPAAALEAFWALLQRWRDGVASLTDEQLDMVGFGQYPYGLDRELPFVRIVWWTNREFIHHMAEIALLRDLWWHQARSR